MTHFWPAALVASMAFASVHGNERPAPAPSTSAADAIAATQLEWEDGPLYAAPTGQDRIGRIAAPVMINGQGPFRLILDTGANQSVITTRLAQQLGLTLTPESQLMMHGVTGSLQVPSVVLESFETGDLVQRNVKVAVLDTVMGGADGILGTQGFEGMRITVDFRRDRITIERSRGQRARSTEGTIPAELKFGRLLVCSGYVGAIRVKAVIDTGAQMTLGNLALRDALLRRRGADHGPDNATVIGLNLAEQTGRYLHTPRILLGDAEIENAPIIYGDIHVFKMWELEDTPAILVGMDILGALEKLVIDYRREEIQFRNAYRLN